MAVSVNDRYIRTISSAAQTVFTYDFPIATASDITILHTDVGTWVTTTLVYSTDYTLTAIGNDAGGTFVLNVAAAANDIYTAYGSTPYARATDFTGATSVTTDAINTDYNEEEKQIQQNRRDISRCLKLPLEDNILTVTSELPIATDRAGMYLRFDGSGNATVDAGTSGTAAAGGSNTQIQYNSSGVLDGDSGFTTNGLGSVNIVGDLDVDNININGNTISSTNSNGDIVITPNGTGNLDLSGSTEAMKMPSGTTAQRPASPEVGFVRYNTTDNTLETYDGSSWIVQSGGSGDVTGPGSSTDNAVVRFNSTGGTLIQDSGVIISDLDAVTGLTALDVDNINIDGNTISSTNTNGDINFIPDGTGDIELVANTNITGTFNINTTTAVDGTIDDDTMATASATKLATSESIKAYVDSMSSSAGGLVFINSVTASTSASVSLIDCFSATYRNYFITISGLVPVNTSTFLDITLSTDSGSTWVSSGYHSSAFRITSVNGTFGAGFINNGAQVRWTNSTNAYLETGSMYSFAFYVMDPFITANDTKFTGLFSGFYASRNEQGVCGAKINAAEHDSIQFAISSGNISGASIRVYGIANN